ncbi:MAG: hypothetical protein WCT04_05775 [Planctomycetota bacterium]
MRIRWQYLNSLLILLTALVSVTVATAAEPGTGYVTDPAVEKLIEAALDPEKAVAFPAQKKLAELGGAAERALNFKLMNEKTSQGRRPYADLIARCCPGRVGYRVTLEMTPDGTGILYLESDRTMLAECAQKSDRINGKPERVFPEEELRRNPYSKVDLAKHLTGTMKYNQGASVDANQRILANGEVAFSNFDDLAAFANSFDRAGYHMLNGISLYDNNDIRTLHFKKSAENDRSKSTSFLLMFHDVKWEFVLDFKGALKSQNASRTVNGKYVWRFNCAQMLGGEAEIEAGYDPRALVRSANPAPRPSVDPLPPLPVVPTPVTGQGPVAIVAQKMLHVALGRRFDPATEPNPNAPDTIAVLDGTPSTPPGEESTFQWMQTAGVPLNLDADKLKKRIIKMRFYEVGKYAFELTRTINGVTSAPAEVTIMVGENVNMADNSDGVKRQSELPPKSAGPLALPNPRPLVEPKPQTPVPPPPIPPTPPPVAVEQKPEVPFVAVTPAKPIDFKPSKILLDEIRLEETAYYSRHATNVSHNSGKEAEPVTPPGNVQPTKPIQAPDDAKIALNDAKIKMDEIRREEEKFNSTRPVKVNPVEPVVPKVIKPVPPSPIKPEVVKPIEIEKPRVIPTPEVVKPLVNKTIEKPDVGLELPPKKDVKVEPPPVVPPLPPEPQKPVVTPKLDPVKPPEVVKPIEKVKVPEVVKPIEKIKVPEVIKPPEVVKPTPSIVKPAVTSGAGSLTGMQLIKVGQYSAAVEVLKAEAQANPKDAAIQMALGIALFEAAEKPDGFDRAGTQAALDVFTDVLRANEQNAQAFMYAGHCSGHLNREERMSFVRKAISLDKKKVAWEIRWYSGNKSLKEKDFAGAVNYFADAEVSATEAGIKDPRLLRDMAIAFHGNKQDDEAIKRVNALWELGYLPEAKLVDELRKAAPAAVKVPESAYAPGGMMAVAGKTPDVKPEAVAVKPDPTVVKPTEKTAIVSVPETGGNVTPKLPPGTPVVKPEVPLTSASQTVKDLDKYNPKDIPSTPRPTRTTVQVEVPKERPRVVKVALKVPETFEAALDSGKKALARGQRLMQMVEEELKQNDEGAKPRIDTMKLEAQECWDEAETMLRGAWEKKPDDVGVKGQFDELAKQVGVVALVKSPLLISKPNGLVVLNAEPSIVYPEGKPMYYAWQQVDGKELNLRREDLDKKTVGLRIKIPGTYKFELVVSDGSRGGNPVTVIVEVR